MITEAIDFRYLLIENYKKLKLTETELATIFVVDHLISQGNPFITADLLSLKMSLDVKEIDRILAKLLTKGMFEYKTVNKTTVATLEPLKQKLYREFQLFLSKEEEEKSSKRIKEELENVFTTFEKLLGRSLSPVEVSKIHEWISYGYSDKTIIDALKEALSKNKDGEWAIRKALAPGEYKFIYIVDSKEQLDDFRESKGVDSSFRTGKGINAKKVSLITVRKH